MKKKGINNIQNLKGMEYFEKYQLVDAPHFKKRAEKKKNKMFKKNKKKISFEKKK